MLRRLDKDRRVVEPGVVHVLDLDPIRLCAVRMLELLMEVADALDLLRAGVLRSVKDLESQLTSSKPVPATARPPETPAGRTGRIGPPTRTSGTVIIREVKFVNGVVLALAAVIGVAVLVAAVVGGANLLRSATDADEVITLLRPAAGEARPDYLPDGTPVWVIGHEDGSASVISGFDTHTPMNVGKLLWWCEELRLLDNPHHGSHWDEYGTKIGGPAPSGLPTWQQRVQGNRLVLGPPQAPAQITGGVRPQGLDRSPCFGPDGDVVFHTFSGWKLWTSPQAAIEARPTDWLLIEGVLTVDAGTGRTVLCAVGGCADAAEAAGIDTPPPNMEFGPLGRDRFIARVRDGALADLTRVVWRAPQE